jgi:predicted metal-binding membrane protein
MSVRLTGADPLRRERHLVLAALFAFAGGAWLLLIWQAASADNNTMTLTMGMDAPLFLAMWVAMMVAMMLPAAAPMALTFARVHASKRERGESFVPTWVFVSSYLLLWAAFGTVAYFAAVAVDSFLNRSMWLMDNLPRIGGGVIVLAGVYQLSTLKRVCLAKCRSRWTS